MNRSVQPALGGTVEARIALRDYVQLLRPTHWIKNIVVLAGPAAGLKLLTAADAAHALLTTVVFCLASSSVYALNDVVDRRADARHPAKRFRPVACGAIGPPAALFVSGTLLVVAFAPAILWLPQGVVLLLGLYVALTVAYSLALKERVILDVIVIAVGFVLRAWAGTTAVGVGASTWLIACVFTLCLFIGFGKRRCELVMIGNPEDAARHRGTLVRYTPDLLSHLIAVSAGIAVITFLLYTLDASVPSAFAKEHLFYTLPIVVYGIFRFAMLSELGRYSGPTEMLLKDPALLATFLLWTACALGVAYQGRLLGDAG